MLHKEWQDSLNGQRCMLGLLLLGLQQRAYYENNSKVYTQIQQLKINELLTPLSKSSLKKKEKELKRQKGLLWLAMHKERT